MNAALKRVVINFVITVKPPSAQYPPVPVWAFEIPDISK